MMVVRANKAADGIGGHLSTFASSASLYEIGFNHFFRGKDDGTPGDHVYFQGHAAPGVYARAFLEGRLTEDDLDHFRREIGRGGRGLSSLSAPAPDARLLGVPDGVDGPRPDHRALPRPLQPVPPEPPASTTRAAAACGRSSATASATSPRRSARSRSPSREQLDNLVFVVNCNLQRLDGPVRGNGKVIQELEATFRGAGWNVIKVIWGSKWDDLLAQDKDGVLLNKMNTTVDGEFQRYAVESGEYIRENFFGPDERLRKMVAAPHRRRAAQPASRRPRLPQAVRRLQGRHREPRIRSTDGDPLQDDQGLDARPGLRGPQLHAPDQEDDQGSDPGHARPSASRGRDPRRRPRRRAPAVLHARRRTRSSTST